MRGGGFPKHSWTFLFGTRMKYSFTNMMVHENAYEKENKEKRINNKYS